MSPRRNWNSPTPSLASECAPPPGNKGAGGTLVCGRGGGRVPIPTTGEKAYHSAYSVVRTQKRKIDIAPNPPKKTNITPKD